MVKVAFSLSFIGILLCLSICSIHAQEEPFKKWCISQIQTSDSKLQQVLDDVCARISCKEILPGGSCYTPNNYKNHGSYAIDLDYRVNNVCDQSYATFTANDPSYATCVFP
ncbi:X8 domain-containing protein [Artemisia annua]|uniref:X8 domain-containing protein n=1 Tax=Artemisia annua TaxID=35608 RepID=A0A2U1LXQ8_ARTAN|nr:X8 domain-containing protein [Artemisia annua]